MTDFATYCPEDNKLRLYVGRVPRDEYEELRRQGWTSTPKQDCDFVATWTPEREDTALEYAGYIGDEDQSPEDRAADRAERFSVYRDKRAGEAGAAADAFDAGPSVFGHQNADRAERQARRHDRHRLHAVCQWSKAEYWQQRTAGVIAHALHRSDAATRRGRILRLEAEQRKHLATVEEYAKRYAAWQQVAAMPGADSLIVTDEAGQMHGTAAGKLAYALANSGGCWGDYIHPRTGRKSSLYSLLTDQADRITPAEAAALWLAGKVAPDAPGTGWARWSAHYELRLGYERQMLANEGGTAGDVEMQPGGMLGRYLIVKVNKSAATGAVVSVNVHAPKRDGEGWDYRRRGDTILLNVQRMSEHVYSPPTPESLALLADVKGKQKEQAQARNATAPKLINPTKESAEALQAELNRLAAERGKEANRYTGVDVEPSEVLYMTQAEYTAKSGGTYSSFETYYLRRRPMLDSTSRNMYGSADKLPIVCKVRAAHSSGGSLYRARRLIVITDKPQKPLPDWTAVESQPVAAEAVAR